jgi:AbrB family looped-hinge helix DNA binding protein
MTDFSTTRLSSRGQVVIPEEIRHNLGLKEGDQFIVIGQGDAVILKTINPPGIDQFMELLAQAQAEVKSRGLKKANLRAAISKVRRRKK